MAIHWEKYKNNLLKSIEKQMDMRIKDSSK